MPKNGEKPPTNQQQQQPPPPSPAAKSTSGTLPGSFFKCKSVTELVKQDVKRKVSSAKVFNASQTHTSKSEAAALHALYDSLIKKQKELQSELANMQIALEKSKKEKERLESERNRALFLYEKQQDELNEMHVQRETDSELIRSLKNDLDKLYLSFKNYRESKEAELQYILKQNAKLFCMWLVYLKLLSSNNNST